MTGDWENITKGVACILKEYGFYLVSVGVPLIRQNNPGGGMEEKDRWEGGRLVRQLMQ